jgi:hypothetical protein
MVRITWLTMLLLATVLVAACAGAGATGAPPSSASPAPSVVVGPVTTEDDAIAAVIAHEPRLAGIQPRDPDMIGQSAWYEVAPASGVGAFIVTVRVGWGDCPSGCIEEHSWTYAVLPDGAVNRQSDSGSAVPPDAWPAPDAGGAAGSGLQITAVAGPNCPVETIGADPACAPRFVPNVTVLISDASGAIRHKLVLDASGQGFLAMDPGAYVVNAEGVQGFMNGPEAQKVTVEAGQVTDVTLSFDTGIR